jgi:hypothetical protein
VLSALDIKSMDDNDKEDVINSLTGNMEESDEYYYDEDLSANRGGDDTEDLLFDSDVDNVNEYDEPEYESYDENPYVDSYDGISYEELYENDVAPAEPTTKPITRPSEPSRRERPFRQPPFIKPGEEPRPKAELRRGGNTEEVLHEDHFNDDMETYEQEQAYLDLEDMVGPMGYSLDLCHKEDTNDPERNTIYFDLKDGSEKLAKIRVNSMGQIEIGYMEGKNFIGQPVDNIQDITEYLEEENVNEYMEMDYDTMMADAPAEPTTKPDVKPAQPQPSRRERPFRQPPFIKPGEEPRPKASK